MQAALYYMVNKKAKNCWEYWDNKDCKKIRDTCPAYTTDSGAYCWMVAGSFTEDPKTRRICFKFKGGRKKGAIKHCWECSWFKLKNPDFD